MLTPTERTQLIHILQRFPALKSYRIFIFGSRATNTNRRFSDIDLGFLGPTPLPPLLQSQLEEAFEDSNLPYLIDIVDFHHVTPQFKQIALSHTDEVQLHYD